MNPEQQTDQILTALRTGQTTEQEALSSLLALGMPEDIARESVFIAQGGSDVIPLD